MVTFMLAIGAYVIVESISAPSEISETGLIMQEFRSKYQIVSIGSECVFPAVVKTGDFVLLANEDDLLIQLEEGLYATAFDNVVAVE